MNNAALSQLTWLRSSRSYATGQCITCARLPGGGMAVKDSKHPDGPTLLFPATQWQAFAEHLKTRRPTDHTSLRPLRTPRHI